MFATRTSKGLDLASLRMVVNGAEPVSPSTIHRFTDRFRRYGFKPDAMAPVYGLAENVVGLAFPPPGRLPIIDRVDRDRLSREGLAVPAKTNGAAMAEFVACGRAIPGHQVRVVDDGNRELPDRHEGRLQFKGPSATQGYFRNEEKNRTLFCNGWLESGDRAYVAEGDVYLTGRIKDMIIRAGRNLYPQELEELIGGVGGVRKGCVAAFASQDPRAGTEQLVLVAETRLRDAAALAELRNRIAEASVTLLDLPPDEILLLPPGSVPKTSSGKLRRSAARQLYENGDLGSEKRPVWLQLARLSMSSFAHRIRRLGSSFAEFAFAGWWWALLCVIAAPVWLLVLALPRRDWRHAVIHWGARTFLQLTGARLTVEAEAPIPPNRVMLVANHSGYLDGVVLSATIPGPLSFVAKEELSNQFIAGTFLSRIGTLFARRFDPRAGVEDTETQFKAAQEGERIVSMPEGTLSRMPGLLPFHLGAFLVAAEAGIPIVPVTVSGTRSVLRGEQWFPRRGHIHVHIGAPLMPAGGGFEAAVRLRDAARTQILSRCGEPDLAHERAI